MKEEEKEDARRKRRTYTDIDEAVAIEDVCLAADAGEIAVMGLEVRYNFLVGTPGEEDVSCSCVEQHR